MTHQYKELQAQISQISNQLAKRMEEVLDILKIEYVRQGDRITMCCPVHNGDNPTGCVIFLDGTPHWKCWTKSCHEDHKQNIFGLVYAIIGDFHKTIKFCESFLNCNVKEVEFTIKQYDRTLKQLNIFNRRPEKVVSKLTREDIKSRLKIPSDYYLSRNYSSETLEKFDIGDCTNPKKFMSNRAVVPVYDIDGDYIGSTGRGVYDEVLPKWKNTPDFKKSNFLYGLNLAKEKIEETNTIILVEGPGDVWRLHEAGYENSLAIFGANLSELQLLQLEMLPCLNLIIMTDYDDAGKKAAIQIQKICGRRFNITRPLVENYKDVGEMPIEIIKEILK